MASEYWEQNEVPWIMQAVQARGNVEDKAYQTYYSYKSSIRPGQHTAFQDGMLDRFFEGQKRSLTNRFNKLNNLKSTSALDFDELKKLTSFFASDLVDKNGLVLKDGSGSPVGNKIVEILNSTVIGNGSGNDKKTLGDVISTTGSFSLFGTGNKNGIALSHTSKIVDKLMSNLSRNSSTMINALNKNLNDMIDVFAINNKDLDVALIKAMYIRNPGGIINTGNQGNFTISGKELTASESKAIKAINTLKTNISELSKLSKNKSATKDDVQRIVEAIQACFNSIAGTAEEAAVNYAINEMNRQGYLRVNEEIQDIVKKVGMNGAVSLDSTLTGAITQAREGEAVSSGKELMNDVEVTWNSGGMSLTFGGSIKLRQGQGFKSTRSGFGLELTAREGTYEKMIKRVEAVIPGARMYGYAMVANLKGRMSEYNDDWYKLRMFLGAVSFADAMTGLGGSINDFSSLMIINNRIFSVYDILDRIATEEAKKQILKKGSHNAPYTVKSLYLEPIRNEVEAKVEKENTKRWQAVMRTENAYKILNAKKVSVSINFANLYNGINLMYRK